MKVTFGETDGDAEAAVLRGILGYIVRIDYKVPMKDPHGDPADFEEQQDIEVRSVDSTGISGYLTDDDGERIEGSPSEFYAWADVDEVYIY